MCIAKAVESTDGFPLMKNSYNRISLLGSFGLSKLSNQAEPKFDDVKVQ